METQLIGVSQHIEQVRELISQIADACLNTVVCGETAVGKESVVKVLSQKSCKKSGPYNKS